MFKVVWDKENNGVILTMKGGAEELNPPRPVFYEELDMLGLKERGWAYPNCDGPLMWACDRRYFHRGELVMEVKGGNIFDKPTIEVKEGFEGLLVQPVNMDALKEANEDTMFLLEHEAMNFIDQTYRRYKKAKEINDRDSEGIDMHELAELQEKKTHEKHVVVKDTCDSFDVIPEADANKLGKSPIISSKVEMFVSSFSGGKDSQVVLDLVARTLPSDDFCVIYSDTGYELPHSLELYEELKKHYQKQYPELQFFTATNHQSVLYYWDKIGAPSRIRRWCCSVMKSAPLALLLKEISGLEKQPHVILFDGVRAEESLSRSNRGRIGVNVKHNNMINISPILEWNQFEVYLYLLLNKIPINKAYRLGLSRVGCVLCPYSSHWSEELCGKYYPQKVAPFVSRLRDMANNAKIKGVDNYIKTGGWKVRSGGRDIQCESSINIVSENPDFQAIIHHPQENIFTWLKALGEYSYSCNNQRNIYEGQLKFKNRLFKLTIKIDEKSDSITIKVDNTLDNVIFIGLLKRVLYKTTYCAHCEVCEVECPTGALNVIPIVSINTTKCIHCHKCLKIKSKGCIAAESLSVSYGEKNNNMKKSEKSGINRYNDGMGLREKWLNTYFATHTNFFSNTEHGLNVKYQLPPFINWLSEACILNPKDQTITPTGNLLKDIYQKTPYQVWEIVFINLCRFSEICHWFYGAIGFDKAYTREEMDVILQNSYPELQDRTLSNPFNSLINTFKESPISSPMGMISLTKKGGKLVLTRNSYNDLSLLGVAYSLYQYADEIGRKDLTISELYQDGQKRGVYRQFGIQQDVLERKLRSLQESYQVLTVNLNMGLDNINLREDLEPFDILKMLVK